MNKTGKKLPVGIDDFEKLRTQEFYYVDKTALIADLMNNWGEVNLFTRPRRFGKTLNMSMLKCFFETGTDPAMFDGLAVSREPELCREYQGKYPVVFLSLKGVSGPSCEKALRMLKEVVSNECQRLHYLADSPRVSGKDRVRFMQLLNAEMDEAGLQFALSTLMRMLHAHYGRRVILLIDEYDVPLDKANDNGYYREMADFLRGFFGEAFKTNPDLFFAVVTGCLRISKESIFTGINNLKVDTVADERFDEFFGFTDAEVRKLLADYGLSGAYAGMKEWYDGYRFGNVDLYCPWDVLCHCDRLRVNPEAEPDLYWDNSSSNQLVRRLIDVSDAAEQRDIERLIAGETLEKKLVMNLTYDELRKKELLWSALYQTGYLTQDRTGASRRRGTARLVIPNREIRELFIEKVQDWFVEKTEHAGKALGSLYRAAAGGDAPAMEEILNRQLRETISYYDSYEGFYHGFLLGLLKANGEWAVRSNRESGNGRSDIQIEGRDGVTGIVIEVKRAKEREDLAAECEAALRQIVEKSYADALHDEGIREVWAYGIAFFKKRCCVLAKRLVSADR